MAVRQPEGVGNLPEFRRVLQERAEPDRNQGMQVVQGVVDDVDHARTQLDIGLLQGMVVRCQQPQRPTLDLDDGTVDLFPDMAVLALYGAAEISRQLPGLQDVDRKSTRLKSSHKCASRMPS